MHSRSLVLVLGLVALAAPLAALQDGREPIPAVDPYTRGDERALEKAGYVSFGPFLWGDGHSTGQLEESLGGVPVLFVETAHFRLASTLEAYQVREDPAERDHIEAELKRLKKRLPRVKPKERELDPWLRLHLYAQRLEELYADFLEAFRLEEDLFPVEAPVRRPGEPFEIGAGPYLGLHQKFTVLLTQKTSSLARYSAVYLDQAVQTPYRYYFGDIDSFHYCGSYELMGEAYGNDVAFQCAVTFGVAQNLVNAFGGYTHNAPLWLRVGVARWFMRRVDPRWMLYVTGEGELGRTEEESDWAPKVRARVKNDYYPSMAEMLAWVDDQKLVFADHLFLWSRADWLLSEEPEKAGEFLKRAMAPIPWGENADRAALEQAQFASAFEQTFGAPEEVDAAWSKWVLKTYAK